MAVHVSRKDSAPCGKVRRLFVFSGENDDAIQDLLDAVEESVSAGWSVVSITPEKRTAFLVRR